MSFSVLRERKKMSEKKSEWYAEDRKPFRRMEEQFICDKLGLKSTNVLFRIPRNRIFETDGGNPDDDLQVFKSDDLPKYVEGKVESIIRASGKHRLVISLKPFEFKNKEKLRLYGAYGWKTGNRILNEFCREMCKQDGVASARSMMLSDLIGLEWRGNTTYQFDEHQYSVESFLQGRQEEPGTIRTYPTWKASKSRDFGLFDECLYEEMSLECLNFWLATKVAMPVAKFQGGHDGLIYSMAYYENGHVCMDSGIFGTNGRELGFSSAIDNRHAYLKRECEWGTENNVRAVVLMGQQAFEDSQGPIIIPD